MSEWRKWREMAEDSRTCALEIAVSFPRSSVSRSYYAAYSLATAFLLYKQQQPPAGREAWAHPNTDSIDTSKQSRTNDLLLREAKKHSRRANDASSALLSPISCELWRTIKVMSL
ncbi:MAG: hypothetical protein NT023_15140 [Armatimonadetes bacterium]|nr:hypothetical protein [Armatimonadota bacterium]